MNGWSVHPPEGGLTFGTGINSPLDSSTSRKCTDSRPVSLTLLHTRDQGPLQPNKIFWLFPLMLLGPPEMPVHLSKSEGDASKAPQASERDVTHTPANTKSVLSLCWGQRSLAYWHVPCQYLTGKRTSQAQHICVPWLSAQNCLRTLPHSWKPRK